MHNMDAVQGEATAFFENLVNVKGSQYATLIEALFHLRQLACISGNDSIPASFRHALSVTISGRVAVALATLTKTSEADFIEAVNLAKTFDKMADSMISQMPEDETDKAIKESLARMQQRMNGTH